MYQDEFKNLPLSDRFMFGEVMRNPGICKLFLEELLQCKIERIVFATKEADLSDTVLGHGIRLDVFLADEHNTHYDIEMQNTSDSIEKRSRYYQSVIDRELLRRSMDYDKLPESFIIFVCNFDCGERLGEVRAGIVLQGHRQGILRWQSCYFAQYQIYGPERRLRLDCRVSGLYPR